MPHLVHSKPKYVLQGKNFILPHFFTHGYILENGEEWGRNRPKLKGPGNFYIS
jgi:hypothetical protein